MAIGQISQGSTESPVEKRYPSMEEIRTTVRSLLNRVLKPTAPMRIDFRVLEKIDQFFTGDHTSRNRLELNRQEAERSLRNILEKLGVEDPKTEEERKALLGRLDSPDITAKIGAHLSKFSPSEINER